MAAAKKKTTANPADPSQESQPNAMQPEAQQAGNAIDDLLSGALAKPSAKRSIEDIHREIAEVELQTKLLNLEQAKRDNVTAQADQRSVEQRRAAAKKTLGEQRASAEMLKNRCRHRKGGFGLEQTLRGDGKHSLILMESPIAGHKYILCFRCQGEWRTPQPSLKRTDPEKYLEELKEFNRILELANEADSRPMGAPVFAFEKNGVPFVPDLV